MHVPAAHFANARLVALAWLAMAGWLGVAGAEVKRLDEPDLLKGGAPLRFQLEIPADGLKSLRQEPRTYVRATVREGTNVLHDVALRLKGRTGSFRGLDDKPAFTLDFDRFVPAQHLHGLSKIHLNNSVEDPSYLHEKLGAELFRAAGIPAPRVSHALVEMNGQRLGLYVLKEGFAEEFLAQHFRRTDGNLYEPEPGPGSDVTGAMRRSSGTGVADGSDLRRLASAASQTNLSARWSQLGTVLDADRFLTFIAMEVLVGHRDGYGLAKNNYRLYHDPTADRFVFLPGGMDQLVGRTQFSLQPRMAGFVAKSVLETSEGRSIYRSRVALLFTNSFQVALLTNHVRRWSASLAPNLSRSEARALLRESEDLCERIERRASEVARQLALPEPSRLSFTNGIAHLDGWRAANPPDGGKLDRTSLEGKASLHIQAGPKTSASWRTKVWLEPGRYRFEARTRAAGVKALTFGRTSGVFLSVPGRNWQGAPPLVGDHDWTLLRVEFDLTKEETEVELLCNLRAQAGEAWFDLESLRLIRVQR